MINRWFARAAAALALVFSVVSAASAGPYYHRVPYGTPIEMRLDQPISSRDLHEGDLVALRCMYNVVVDGYIVIAQGAPGVAEVIGDDGAVEGGLKGQVSLKAVWVRAVDRSRIGITGYLTGLGRPRTIANVGIGLVSGGEVAQAVGAYGVGNLAAGAGIAASGIASAQKGGEAKLDQRVRFSTQVQNLWGVTIASNIYAGGTDDSPIK